MLPVCQAATCFLTKNAFFLAGLVLWLKSDKACVTRILFNHSIILLIWPARVIYATLSTLLRNRLNFDYCFLTIPDPILW